MPAKPRRSGWEAWHRRNGARPSRRYSPAEAAAAYGKELSGYAPVEKEAMSRYVDENGDINHVLRGTLKRPSVLSTEHLDAAISRHALAEPTTVFRGVSMGDRTLAVGQVVTDAGYTSTSMVEGVADRWARQGGDGPAVFEIDLEVGQHYALPETYAEDFQEGLADGMDASELVAGYELLLPRGMSMEVVEASTTDGVQRYRVRPVR